jgi:transcriptional regulator with XRE-family HTH domain
MDIGKKIRQKRKSLNMSQRKLAEAANISVISVYRYEKGERKPSINDLSKITIALQTNIEGFFNEKGKTVAEENK